MGFAVEFDCSVMLDFSLQYCFHILARNRYLSETTVTELLGLLTKYQLNPANLDYQQTADRVRLRRCRYLNRFASRTSHDCGQPSLLSPGFGIKCSCPCGKFLKDPAPLNRRVRVL